MAAAAILDFQKLEILIFNGSFAVRGQYASLYQNLIKIGQKVAEI